MTEPIGWTYLLVRSLHKSRLIPRGSSWVVWALASLDPFQRLIQVEATEVGPLWVDLSDRGQCGYFLHSCLPNERVETAMLAAGARHFQVIFDVGAHIGYYSLLFARRNPEGIVHAFEPSERTFAILEKNLRNYTNVKLNRVAVAQARGRREFCLSSCSDLSSLVRSVGRKVTVDAVSLDGYCRDHSIDRVDLIKCDAEGAELEVIGGAKGLLGSEHPPLWLLENSPVHRRELGMTEKTLADSLQGFSSERLNFFSAKTAGKKVHLIDCNPDSVSWEEAGANVWVVPEHWKQTFLRLAAEAVPLWE